MGEKGRDDRNRTTHTTNNRAQGGTGDTELDNYTDHDDDTETDSEKKNDTKLDRDYPYHPTNDSYPHNPAHPTSPAHPAHSSHTTQPPCLPTGSSTTGHTKRRTMTGSSGGVGETEGRDEQDRTTHTTKDRAQKRTGDTELDNHTDHDNPDPDSDSDPDIRPRPRPRPRPP